MKAILRGTYTAEALKGLMGGSDRKAAVEAVLSQVGGALESIMFTRGSIDVVVIAEFPDSTSLVGTALALRASGAFSNAEYLEVVDLPSVVEAAKKAAGAYTPAG